MRASGYPKKAMYTMLLTLVVNAVTAPIMIYLLEWGMMGAALSIIFSMFVGTLFVMQHFISRKTVLNFKWDKIRLDFRIVRSILSIGMSPCLMTLVSSSVVFIIIQQVKIYGGSVGVAAYTIANVMLMLVVMILLGLTQGMQPVVGYSYGANRLERMGEALLYTIKVGVTIGVVAFVVGVFFPHWLVAPFNPSQELAEVTINSMRIVTILFPIVGFQIVVTIFFQSIGKVKQSIFLSLSRQLFFLIPAVLILPRYFGLNGVWAAIPVADFLAAVIAYIFLQIQLKDLRRDRATAEEKNL